MQGHNQGPGLAPVQTASHIQLTMRLAEGRGEAGVLVGLEVPESRPGKTRFEASVFALHFSFLGEKSTKTRNGGLKSEKSNFYF